MVAGLISLAGCGGSHATSTSDAGGGAFDAGHDAKDATSENDARTSLCGNKTVDRGEACDGNCPTSCTPKDPCTTAKLVGSAATCDAQCILTPIVGPGCAPPFYVSKTGNNTDGRSWATAWNEMDQIGWSSLSSGDRVFLDGGATEMVYTTAMTVGANGKSGAPITIMLSGEAGRNGSAVIFGGVTQPPYDDQPTYDGSMPTMSTGIDVGGHSWIVIDGTKWGGIAIHGTGDSGITLGAHTADPSGIADQIVLRNIKIYDIGTPEQVTAETIKSSDYASYTVGHWHTKANSSGIYFSYQIGASNVTLERLIISNTSDEGIGEGPCHNMTLRQSWLDNGRTTPDGSPWNYHNHPDGIQNYAWGGAQGPWTIEDTIIGPRWMQGLFPGVTSATTVSDVTVRNVLLLDNVSSNTLAESATNWTFDHVTSYMSGDLDRLGSWNNFRLMDDTITGFTFTDSIFYGKGMSSVANVTFTGNVYWKTSGSFPGFDAAANTNADPRFVDAASYDLALSPGSPAAGLGSRVTSVARLFELFP